MPPFHQRDTKACRSGICSEPIVLSCAKLLLSGPALFESLLVVLTRGPWGRAVIVAAVDLR